MEIRRDDLERAARRAGLTGEQAEALWRALDAPRPGEPVPAPPPARTGALRDAALLCAMALVAGPAIWLVLLAWERWGIGGGLPSALVGIAALLAAARALARRGRPGAGGVLVTAAVALVPAAVHLLQHRFLVAHDPAPPADLGDWLRSRELVPILAAAAAGALALWTFRFPGLLTVPAAALWFAAQSAAAAVFGAAPSWSQRSLVSALVGLALLAAGFGLDRPPRRAHASWLYLCGLVAFWGGLTTYEAVSDLSLALYLLVDLSLIKLGLLLDRRAFAVVGAIGVAGALGRLAESLLDPRALPVALAGIALLLAGGAVLWKRFERAWRRALLAMLPAPIRLRLPPP